MYHKCKKCLLSEAGESKSYQTVVDYLNNLDSSLKVDDTEYERRLAVCRNCENLISGMCLKCGCYVEVRAAFVNKKCPGFDNQKW